MVGLLGTGQQGLRLLAAVNPAFITVKSIADLRTSNQSCIAALCGLQGQGTATTSKDVRVYESYDKLLAAAKSDGLEAVIIALPSHLHAPAALAALEAGLHVFVETPMALKVTDAKQVARKAAEKNLILAVGQQRRYNWIYDHALEMVRTQPLGPTYITCVRSGTFEAGKEARQARGLPRRTTRRRQPIKPRRLQDRLVAGRSPRARRTEVRGLRQPAGAGPLAALREVQRRPAGGARQPAIRCGRDVRRRHRPTAIRSGHIR